MAIRWFFTMKSDEYGTEAFGPYDSRDEALDAQSRVMREGIELNDNTFRWFSNPYPEDENGDE